MAMRQREAVDHLAVVINSAGQHVAAGEQVVADEEEVRGTSPPASAG